MLVRPTAATIHKARIGIPRRDYPGPDQHYAMLQRKPSYTGVTRGKKLVVLVGQKRPSPTQYATPLAVGRWSKLGEWLRGPTNRFQQPASGG